MDGEEREGRKVAARCFSSEELKSGHQVVWCSASRIPPPNEQPRGKSDLERPQSGVLPNPTQ